MRLLNIGLAMVLAGASVPGFAQTSVTGARPGNDIGTGNSLPRSDKASNINAADTRSQIAPTLPNPPVGENAAPRDFLIAARNSLAAGKTGQAQQSLEMAQTRLLDRSVRPSQVNDSSRDPRVQRIEDARQALGNGNTALAMQIIESALVP